LKQLEQALRDSLFAISPTVHGSSVRIPVPRMTSDLRKELAAEARRAGSSALAAVRVARQAAMQTIKKSSLSKDERWEMEKEVQAAVDEVTKDISKVVADKEKQLQR